MPLDITEVAMGAPFSLMKVVAAGGCVAAVLVGVTAGRAPPTIMEPRTVASGDPAQIRALTATPAANAGSDEIVIERQPDGHFWVDAWVNGAVIRFLVDTGASHVMLTPEDAARAGFRLHSSDYTVSYETANGLVPAAPVSIERMEVGAFTARNVTAAVNGGPMRQSLLGMSFLNRMESMEVRGERLVLRR